MSAADPGVSDVAGVAMVVSVVSVAGAGADVLGARGPSPGGENVSLLKLYANGFLQRAQRAQFFGSDERQCTPG